MTSSITSHPTSTAEIDRFLGEDWFDPLEAGVRSRIRVFIEDLLEAELDAALGRERYERRCPSQAHAAGQDATAPAGYRHGHRERSLLGSFGPVTVRVPKARLVSPEGGTREWKSATLPAYTNPH
jgi:transposase-like protein